MSGGDAVTAEGVSGRGGGSGCAPVGRLQQQGGCDRLITALSSGVQHDRLGRCTERESNAAAAGHILPLPSAKRHIENDREMLVFEHHITAFLG